MTEDELEGLSELGKAAVWYCEHGFGIIPVQPRGKVPIMKNGLHDWFNNPEDARELWTKRPNLNIAIVCGEASGNLVVLDFDEDDEKGVHGFDTLSDWEDESGQLTPTATANTGRGGMHYLYRADRPYHPSVNRDLGVDVRGEGSYIVAPPSVHPNGNSYTWNAGDAPWEREVAKVDANVDAFIDYIQRNGGKECGTDSVRRHGLVMCSGTDGLQKAHGNGMFIDINREAVFIMTVDKSLRNRIIRTGQMVFAGAEKRAKRSIRAGCVNGGGFVIAEPGHGEKTAGQ